MAILLFLLLTCLYAATTATGGPLQFKISPPQAYLGQRRSRSFVNLLLQRGGDANATAIAFASLQDALEKEHLSNHVEITDFLLNATRVLPNTPSISTISTISSADKKTTGFRRVRKITARTTGMRGAFSKKYRRAKMSSIPAKMTAAAGSSPLSSATRNDGDTTPPPIVAAKRSDEQSSQPSIAPTISISSIGNEVKSLTKRLAELQKLKDAAQDRPNPLNKPSFISDLVVSNYLESLVKRGRLVMLNHTEIWSVAAREDYGGTGSGGGGGGSEEDDSIGEDDLMGGSSSSDSSSSANSGGAWILRQTLGRDKSIGEKLGESIEMLAYRVVCKEVMNAVVKAFGCLHGVNVLDVGDIR
jgi:hypothetical protein